MWHFDIHNIVPFCTAVMENTRRVRCMWTINYDVEHKIYTEIYAQASSELAAMHSWPVKTTMKWCSMWKNERSAGKKVK
jgi:vacuolar-type H+-ATPase catalytic subunit A/Vma1